MVAAAVVGSAVAGVASSSMQSSAAGDAADAQSQAANDQLAESRRQFNEIQKLLAPYTNAGPGALAGQQNLLGLNGPGAQFQAIDAIAASPQMNALQVAGEGAILQNASATGGLRGGNTQAALAQFRPALLNSLIDQQYNRLGGLTTVGQNSAAMVGNAGQNASNQAMNAYQQLGAAQAGGAMAQGQAGAGLINSLSQSAGLAFGGGGMSNPFAGPQTSNVSLPADYTGYGSTIGGESFGGGGFQNMGFTGYGGI